MTAAATGRPEHAGIGWRKALRFALTENPLADPMEGRTMRPRRVVRRKSKAKAKRPNTGSRASRTKSLPSPTG